MSVRPAGGIVPSAFKSIFAAILLLALRFAGPIHAQVSGTPNEFARLSQALAADAQRDYSTALQIFRTMAQQGHAAAQFHLGSMYRDGRGVLQDYAEAVSWYRLSAHQGNQMAKGSLAVMHREGMGVPQDYAEAARLFREMADQGDAHAQWSLGFMYRDGKGVLQDYVLAHMWWNLAAANFDSRLQESSMEKRNAITSKMTPAQIAEAQKLAREWKPKPSP
jgi:uncharacterized protein